MTQKKSVFVIVGSAIANSSNHQLVKYLQEISKDAFHFLPLIDLKTLPHFDPILSLVG
ncbi:hypothetical protein [Emticicia oligotrophica]|uniref:hypothetical protein n=1 Tax=Emticicia oligotrophica TaxID=312279 RepID=UPI0002DFE9CD|nr:hypothetical protein [Emticicia oligotrophica]